MITIVVGTNREKAVSRKVADIYRQILSKHGAESQLLDLAELPRDFIYSALYENNGKNEAFNEFRQTMEQQEKFVFIVPEYNGSFPGVLKAFIDGLEYPSVLTNKKSALVGVSAGMQGGTIALSHFTDVLNYLGVNVLAFKPKLAHIYQHLKNGHFTNTLYQELLEEQATQLIAF